MAVHEEDSHNDENRDLLVVGLGASAGGLEALEAFFDAMPDSTGMAFVVIIHLSPDHESSMAPLLQEHTSLQVSQITKKTKIKPNHVYIIPPGKLLSIENQHLVLTAVNTSNKKLTTIDLFFRSLGEAKGTYSACVILSGTGSDGAVGLKTIKENGGIVIAQAIEEAGYNAMPYNAVQTGMVDVTLPVKEIPAKLKEYQESLRRVKISDSGELPERETKVLGKIFEKVNMKMGHDFTQYKRSSILRRIERRMRVNRINSLPDYLEYVTEHPPEVKELFKDLLISVTNFFRDPDAFSSLKETIIPKLFEDKDSKDSVRVWVPGCATGEEAYSLAMLLHEHAQTLSNPPQIQIFATDIDEKALVIARKGCYNESIVADISIDRLHQYFKKEGPQYCVNQNISNMILFAAHNLLKDPPFSKLDLISCRNLLIYLNRDLQSEVFNLFHYALKPGKWLFLGMSDSILEATDLFNSIDKKNQIYQQSTVSKSHVRLPRYPLSKQSDVPTSHRQSEINNKKQSNIEDLHQRLLFKQFEPASVIINKNYEVLHSTSDIERFLKYSGGEPSQKILNMVIPDLRKVLSRLLFQVKQDATTPASKKVRLNIEGSYHYYNIIVRRISEPNFSEGLLHVVFMEEPDETNSHPQKVEHVDSEAAEESDIIAALENELEHTKEQLHVTIEEYETSNEELQASNEELQSMNEELRSTTEQLETSKEELQSVNEELKSVNTELEHKIEKLNEANSNLKNLMESTDIATLFIDSNNRLQFYTSSATDLFNLIASDTGRPFSHVTHQLNYDSIQADIDRVTESLQPIKKIVQDEKGNQYIMRLRPYRSVNDIIDGVVLTLVDVTQLKEAEEKLKQRAERQEIISELGIFTLQEDELNSIIGKAIENIRHITGFDYCFVFSIDNQKDYLTLISSNLEDGTPDKTTIELDTDWDVGYALTLSEPLITEDYHNEQRYNKIPLLDKYEVTSGLQINIGGREKNLGVLSLYAKEPKDFSKFDINFIKIITNIIGSAIERKQADQKLLKINKQLKKEVERSTDLQKQILSNSMSQRWELGGYLHDTLAQNLAYIKMILSDLNDELSVTNQTNASDMLDKIKSLVDLEIDNIRELSHDIIPIDVEEEGISHAFTLLMRRSQRIHNIKCTLKANKILDKINNRELSSSLYNITREAIKNAATHGKAKRILVVTKQQKDQFKLEIKDDGKGFSPEETNSKGMGLRIIGHRVELLGGTFAIDRLPDSEDFTICVRCTFPLESIR
ncbi:GAF domain-containing protein [Balneolaceae bacterium YR4-1]|uniref:GAF domain-containing protein n=1 Tax=Halalkalibaculum roseum TaxID=2709311 RepID=A0A6M1SU26_9BACT|nr:CheR family methyltransferase [Halalkalibaculum roseum]NGP75656.1 GAF domain-containing protein [Halalkalibaculum roseum]